YTLPLLTVSVFFYFLLRPPPCSTLFPYTTLFRSGSSPNRPYGFFTGRRMRSRRRGSRSLSSLTNWRQMRALLFLWCWRLVLAFGDRKSTRLNSSHRTISYAVFCLKKKIKKD